MNPEEIQNNIALYYSKLPPKLQEAFSSMHWLESLKKVAVKYGLSGEQETLIGSETTLVLLSIISAEEYYERLRSELLIPDEQKEAIIREINMLILKDILPDLAITFKTNAATTNDAAVGDVLMKQFEKLPPQMKDILNAMHYPQTISEISKKHNLNVEQMGDFEKLVSDLILGNTDPEKFRVLLADKLKLPQEEIKIMVREVDDRISKRIRQGLGSPSVSDDDEKLLSSAGINIIKPLDTDNGVKKAELREEILQKIESPEKTSVPIFAQKLSAPTQSAPVQTVHTEMPKPPANPSPAAPRPDGKKYDVDPYRELPE